MHFTACGIGHFSRDNWGENLGGFFGWHGLGGQLLLLEPETNRSLSYLTTSMSLDPPWEDRRSIELLREFRRK